MNTRFVSITIRDVRAELDGVLCFYTRREAAIHAESIGWPKSCTRRLMLPFGRITYVVSDVQGNALLRT